MGKLLMPFLFLFVLIPQFGVAQEGVPVATNTAVSEQSQVSVAPTPLASKDPYVTSLEQTVEILSKTNDALNQRWTPLNVTLSALSALFTIITILWGIVFAFGYITVQSIREHKKQFLEDSTKQKSEMQDAISEYRSAKEKIVGEGEEILTKFKDKKKTFAELEEELKGFIQKSEKTIERLEDKTLVTVSGIRNTMLTASAGPFSLAGTQNALVCENCGSVFYENPPKRTKWGLSADMSRGLYAVADSDLYISPGTNWKTGEVLCHKCREGGK